MPPVVEAQSPNHWMAKEVPAGFLFKKKLENVKSGG